MRVLGMSYWMSSSERVFASLSDVCMCLFLFPALRVCVRCLGESWSSFGEWGLVRHVVIGVRSSRRRAASNDVVGHP
ncbi:hypothetical protein EV363DRAFT_1318609 [Boletus edulis]|nr:hypothetical protein EV363DRAFT_1318609 [Boletus edulis]